FDVPELEAPVTRRQPAGARIEPDFGAPDDFDSDPFDLEIEPERPAPARPQAAAHIENPAPRPTPGARIRREAQTSLLESTEFKLPSLHVLAEPKVAAKQPGLSKDALEQNARLLEGVLEDFGVKGEILHVRPGPVVTL